MVCCSALRPLIFGFAVALLGLERLRCDFIRSYVKPRGDEQVQRTDGQVHRLDCWVKYLILGTSYAVRSVVLNICNTYQSNPRDETRWLDYGIGYEEVLTL